MLPTFHPKQRATIYVANILTLFLKPTFNGFIQLQAANVALFHNRFVDVADPRFQPTVPEATFVELFALCSALPGPGSTQLATALGATFGGLMGAIITFFVWQMPGSLMMTLAGLWFHSHMETTDAVQYVTSIADQCIGLVAAAFAMVVIAAVKISHKTCGNSKILMGVCVSSAAIAVLVPPSRGSWIFILLLGLGGTVALVENLFVARREQDNPSEESGRTDLPPQWNSGISPGTGVVILALFLFISGFLAFWNPSGLHGKLLKSFWKIGATVFGGGQVVIPWILNEVVETDWLPSSVFLSGFGIVGISPGPMFNISWFIGAAMLSWQGALLASAGLFAPGILLVIGILPFWERARHWSLLRTFFTGVNAAAAGLIVAAVWMLLHRALVGPLAFSLAVVAGAMIVHYGMPTPLAILGCGGLGAILVRFNIGGPYH